MRRILRFLAAGLTASVTGAFVYTLATLMAAQGAAIVLGLLLLPHYLALLVLYAAGLAFIPVLVVGALLAAAAGLGPATRSSWFWAGCGGIAMLVLFPYLESFGRDPASGLIKSGAAVGAGMLGMLAFRGVLGVARSEEPSRKQIDPSIFMAGGVLGTMLVGAIIWRASYDDQHRFEVRPATMGMSQATADMTPVDVTLHEYTESETDARYLTTGKSLTMRIARSYLDDINAQRGGALKELRLHLRKDNFAPVGAIAAQRHKGRLAQMRATDELLRRISADVTLSASDGPRLGSFAARAERLAGTPSSSLGEHCGLVVASEGINGLHRREEASFQASSGIAPDLDIVAAVVGAGDHGATGFHCYAHHDSCAAQFSYHGFPGGFWLPKKRLCEWRAETRRLFDFLDQHLVRQTERRSES